MLDIDKQVAKKLVEFIREKDEDLYDIVVVSNQCVGTIREVCVSGGWIEVPRGVAQPLGALIDAFSDVDYDSIINEYSKTVKYTMYKIVVDEDFPIERGVEDGLYSVFLKRTNRYVWSSNTDIHYYLNEVVDGTKGSFRTLSLYLISGKHTSNLSNEKRIRYNEIVNKYWMNNSFAFNSYRDEGKGNKLAKYTSDLGNTCYMGIEFIDNGIEARLKLYVNPAEFEDNLDGKE